MTLVHKLAATVPAIWFACFFTSGPLNTPQDEKRDLQTRVDMHQRLNGIKHVGLAVDERIGGFQVRVYAAHQFAANRAELQKYHADMLAYDRRQSQLVTALQAASGNRKLENELMEQLKALKLPTCKFASRIRLYEVAGLGSDFIELTSPENDNELLLIPLSKISSWKISDGALVRPPLPRRTK